MNELTINKNDSSLQALSYLLDSASGYQAGWISQGKSRSIHLRYEAGFVMCDFSERTCR
jgi:hypothetical protein